LPRARRHTDKPGQSKAGTKSHHIQAVLGSLSPAAIPEGVCETPCSRRCAFGASQAEQGRPGLKEGTG